MLNRRAAGRRQRPGEGEGGAVLFLLYGSDRLAVRERRDVLLQEYLPAGGADFALTRLDGQKCTADEMLRTVQALPFFGDRRVVLVDDLLGRLEARRGRTGPPGAAGDVDPEGEPAALLTGAKQDQA